MFEIEYKGGNGVVISTKTAKLVVDPKTSLVGLKDLPVKDAVELATEARLALNADEALLAIESPGEFGVAGFDIRGVAARRHLDDENQPKVSTMYRVEVEGVRIAVIGNIFGKLSDDQLESLGVLDAVILPVGGGGGYTLDASEAATVVRQLDPKMVVPIHYADSGLKYEVPQEELELFTKELGAPVEEVEKLKLKSASAIPPVLTVMKLARS